MGSNWTFRYPVPGDERFLYFLVNKNCLPPSLLNESIRHTFYPRHLSRVRFYPISGVGVYRNHSTYLRSLLPIPGSCSGLPRNPFREIPHFRNLGGSDQNFYQGRQRPETDIHDKGPTESLVPRIPVNRPVRHSSHINDFTPTLQCINCLGISLSRPVHLNYR